MNEIRRAEFKDIKSMVALSALKRKAYEKANPLFWRSSGHADQEQSNYFSRILNNEKYICLVSEINSEIAGFIIGNLIEAPSVYDPGGLTLMIDDFCVKDESYWSAVGAQLLADISQKAKAQNAIQMLIVSGVHDKTKNEFLQNNQLISTSIWYTGKI